MIGFDCQTEQKVTGTDVTWCHPRSSTILSIFGYDCQTKQKVTSTVRHTKFYHLNYKTMMDHMGNKVVFTGTDFVMRSAETSKAPRRSTNYSGKTEATAVSLSTISSQGTGITNICIDSKEKEEETSELLIRKIAKEMLEALLKKDSSISGDAPKPSDEVSTKPSGSSAREAELAALSDMILSSLEAETESKHAGGSDKHLRKMLREGLEEGECSTHSGKSFASKTNSTRSGTSTESGLSGLSMNEQHGCNAPMDIWHPDFWDGEAGEDVGSDATDGMGGEIVGSTIDFLKREKVVSNESSDEDDSSVWSDTTGLTGIFSEFPEGRRTSNIEVPGTTGLHSIVASKGKVKTVSFSLRFDKVVVRNYNQILSDNPACTKGPSIGLGWEFVEEDFDIEDYEAKRGRLRLTSELLLNRARREKLVRDLGYTEKDIAASVRGANKIKSQRRQTMNNLGVNTKMEEAIENAGKRVLRILYLSK
jgi:hypothetical protein